MAQPGNNFNTASEAETLGRAPSAEAVEQVPGTADLVGSSTPAKLTGEEAETEAATGVTQARERARQSPGTAARAGSAALLSQQQNTVRRLNAEIADYDKAIAGHKKTIEATHMKWWEWIWLIVKLFSGVGIPFALVQLKKILAKREAIKTETGTIKQLEQKKKATEQQLKNINQTIKSEQRAQQLNNQMYASAS